MNTVLRRAWAAIMFLPFLFSCTTYNTRLSNYYNNVKTGNLTQAQSALDNAKLLHTKRNKLLYYLEQGRLYHLTKDFEKSNLYFNAADALIENHELSFGNAILSNITNPMAADYKQEDFEIFMVHYYKALNYLQLGNTEEAVVEARRIGLSNSYQKDKFLSPNNGYTQDAFSLTLQGLLYEANGEINNAFISYRNAADLYLSHNSTYYGTPIPYQLKTDLLKTAATLGFTDQVDIYKQRFGLTGFTDSSSKSELIIFFENGFAPPKEEQNFILTANGNGAYFFTDAWGMNQNVNLNGFVDNEKLSSIRTIRVAMPVYHPFDIMPIKQNLIVNETAYPIYLTQNITALSVALLKERWLKELTNAAIRVATKMAIEKGSEKATTAIADNNTKDTKKDGTKKTEEEKKKDKEHNKAIGEALGLLVNLFNTSTEKADTRGWQTLPAFISYTRVPLHSGENTVVVENAKGKQTTIVKGERGLQFMSITN